MVSSAAEQARWLNAEVGDSLTMIVHYTEAILLQDPLVFLFDFLEGETEALLRLHFCFTENINQVTVHAGIAEHTCLSSLVMAFLASD